jgi:multiple sugar transport system ATP-binding protein
MRYEIAKLHDLLSATMVYVTHDQVEAMTLADRIVVLSDGSIIQVGTPRELYNKPINTFVAQFIGSPKMNVLPCTVSGAHYQLEDARRGDYPHQNPVATHLGIRPEHLTIANAGSGVCDGKVEVVEYLGSDTFVLVDCAAAGQISVRVIGDTNIKTGDVIGLQPEPERTLFFDADGNTITH